MRSERTWVDLFIFSESVKLSFHMSGVRYGIWIDVEVHVSVEISQLGRSGLEQALEWFPRVFLVTCCAVMKCQLAGIEFSQLEGRVISFRLGGVMQTSSSGVDFIVKMNYECSSIVS